MSNDNDDCVTELNDLYMSTINVIVSIVFCGLSVFN